MFRGSEIGNRALGKPKGDVLDLAPCRIVVRDDPNGFDFEFRIVSLIRFSDAFRDLVQVSVEIKLDLSSVLLST
jgi:hypothetical protein